MHHWAAPRETQSAEVFCELTCSSCPTCRRAVNAKILRRDNQGYLRKRCPEYGLYETRIYTGYVCAGRFNKPGRIPLQHSTAMARGCPWDCGPCPGHAQHVCVSIIEVNPACNMACPLGFADAGADYRLSPTEVEGLPDSPAGWVGCLAGARPLSGYAVLLTDAGFDVCLAEDHAESLSARAHRIGKALSARLSFRGPDSLLGGWTGAHITEASGVVERAIDGRQLSYGLIAARKRAR